MANTALGAHSASNNPSLQSPNLRIAISAALRRHGIAPSRFGRDAVCDPRFVLDMTRRDREPRPKTEAKIRAYIASLDAREASHA